MVENGQSKGPESKKGEQAGRLLPRSSGGD